MRKKVVVFVIFIVLLFSTKLSGTLMIGPSYTEIVIKPGDKKEGKIYLKNLKDEAVELICFIEDFLGTEVNKEIKWSDWLTLRFNQESIMLKPGAETNLEYIVKAPKDLEGEVSAKISFLEKESSNLTSIRIKFSAVIYLIAKDKSKIGCEITGLEPVGDGETNNNFNRFKIRIKNTGNIHIRPGGELKIFMNKRVIKTVQLPQNYPLFEGREGFLLSDNIGILKDGNYIAEVRISLGYNDIYEVKKKFKIDIKKNIFTIKELK